MGEQCVPASDFCEAVSSVVKGRLLRRKEHSSQRHVHPYQCDVVLHMLHRWESTRARTLGGALIPLPGSALIREKPEWGYETIYKREALSTSCTLLPAVLSLIQEIP